MRNKLPDGDEKACHLSFPKFVYINALEKNFMEKCGLKGVLW